MLNVEFEREAKLEPDRITEREQSHTIKAEVEEASQAVQTPLALGVEHAAAKAGELPDCSAVRAGERRASPYQRTWESSSENP